MKFDAAGTLWGSEADASEVLGPVAVGLQGCCLAAAVKDMLAHFEQESSQLACSRDSRPRVNHQPAPPAPKLLLLGEPVDLPDAAQQRSGVGRELGPLGIREFVNAQSVTIGPEHHA